MSKTEVAKKLYMSNKERFEQALNIRNKTIIIAETTDALERLEDVYSPSYIDKALQSGELIESVINEIAEDTQQYLAHDPQAFKFQRKCSCKYLICRCN